MKYSKGPCMLCGACVNVCPQEILRMNSKIIKETGCCECGRCAAVCPVNAIRWHHEV